MTAADMDKQYILLIKMYLLEGLTLSVVWRWEEFSLDNTSCSVRYKFVAGDSVTVSFSNDRQINSIFKPHCPSELSLTVFNNCLIIVCIQLCGNRGAQTLH